MITTLLLALVFSLPAKSSEYCLNYQTPSHLAQDRASDRSRVSVAATGFIIANWAILVSEGRLERDKALAWSNAALDALQRHNPARNRGWLYHFTDAEGKPHLDVEVSTVDTALLYCGAKRAAELLGDPEFLARVNRDIAAIDVKFVTKGPYISHGFHWRLVDGFEVADFIPCSWDDYNEGVVIYRLFGIDWKPRKVDYGLPLFVYYYPLCYFDEPEMREHLTKAVEHQQRTYRQWGVTANDGPNGYSVNRADIISPLAVYSIVGLVPQAAEYLKTIPVPPETPAYHPASGWVAVDRLGIDDGCCVLLRHRYRR